MEYVNGYDKQRREEEVQTRLAGLLNEIRNKEIYKKFESPVDIFTLQLKSICGDVNELETKIGNYPGPHFTKVFRTLQGDCAKLQLELDGLDIADRDDIRKDRRNEIIRIDTLAKELSKKAHPGGKSCPECEVYK